MSTNFKPDQSDYKNIGQFRAWCQKVLPLVYDDSVSYYELLGKVLQYLNDVISNINLVGEDMTKLYEAYELLELWVNTYFDDLDVQNEINSKLDTLASDGTLRDMFSPIVSEISKPMVVASVSEMTDTMKTYALSTNGHIYQYKNNTWKDTQLVYATNIANYMTYNTLGVTDLDELVTIGMYKKGSATEAPANIPPNETGTAFMVIVFSDNTKSHLYQMYWTYTANRLYTRMYTGGAFTEWKRLLTHEDLNLLDYYLGWHNELPSYDLNEIAEIGIYFNSRDTVATNIPNGETGLGFMLVCLHGGNNTRNYQFLYSYGTGNLYTRYKRDTFFTEWVRVLNESDLASINNSVSISKVSDTEYRINFGDYRTKLVHVVNADINADLWNLIGVYQGATTVVTSGTDIIGVVKEANSADFMGGVHGDEKNTLMYIMCDGKEWDYVSEITAKTIQICMVSDLYRVGTEEKTFTRNVTLTITHNKIVGEVLFENNIEGLVLYDAPIGGMMACPNNILTGVTMNNYKFKGVPSEPPNNFSRVNTGGTLHWTNGCITVNNLVGHQLDTFTGGAILYTADDGRIKLYFYTDKSVNRVMSLGETLYAKYEYLFS